MNKLEGCAHYRAYEDATAAAVRLALLRHHPDSEIIGGGHDLHHTDGGGRVRYSYRLRPGTSPQQAAEVERMLLDALGDPATVDVSRGELATDREQYVDRDTTQVMTREANRVVQTVSHDDGTTGQRVLVSTARLVMAVDVESGAEYGRVPVRSIVDPATGEQVQFEGARGEHDPSVHIDLTRP